MSFRSVLFVVSLMLLPNSFSAQTLNPEALHKPPTDTWPTYNGDYSGQRYSTLSQVNASNVNTLGLAWTHEVDFGAQSFAQQASEGRRFKATPLLVDGVLYISITDNVWAMDALTGRELWHYAWPNNKAIHVANRGLGMYKSWLFFMTPDDYLVSLNAKDGKERWRVQIADVNKDFFGATSPLVIGDHVSSVQATTTIYGLGWSPEIRKLAHCSGGGGWTRTPASQDRRHGPMPQQWRTEAVSHG